MYYTISEWKALPWWEREVYIEGLNKEFSDEQQDEEIGDMLGITGVIMEEEVVD